MSSNLNISDEIYHHYNDFNFKSILLKRASGLLRFVKIPYEITSVLSNEYTNLGPHISRVDFVCEARNSKETICLIVESQTKLPTEDDINRFFQYASTLRIFKGKKVELYILCTQKAPYDKKNTSSAMTAHTQCT